MRFTSIRLSLWLVGLLISLSNQVALAQVVAPSQGGGVSLISATATTMELRFGGGGTGQGRVVAVVATTRSASVSLAAVDGQFYVAAETYGKGSELGQGYVVYNGTGNTVTVNGLKPNTYYYITNSEYNTDGITIAYNNRTSSMLTATRNATAAITPLPVELTSFTGIVTRNLATLYWTTASEQNTSYFAVERSNDSNFFTEVGRLASSHGSSQSLAYKLSDYQLLTKNTYYRLRQVDNDGTVSYSSVISLGPILSIDQLIEVYPNPSAGQPVNLLVHGYDKEALVLNLTDNLGKSVLTYSFTANNSNQLSIIPLPINISSGIYVLTLNGKNGVLKKRIVLSN